jgi:hypothetical protein
MKNIRAMKIIASIQLFVAFISVFLFSMPTVYGFMSAILIFPLIPVWWFGLRLIYGYYKISKGTWTDLELLKFWRGSLVFNLPGAFIFLYTLNFHEAFLTSTSFSYSSDWFWISPLLGSVIALIAMLIANQIKAELEPSNT